MLTAATENALSPAEAQSLMVDQNEPLPTPDSIESPGNEAQSSSLNAKRKRGNLSVATTGDFIAPHEEQSSDSDHGPVQVAKKQRRKDNDTKAADRLYQKTRRDKKAELRAMYAQIDAGYETSGVVPESLSNETKALIKFRHSLCECVKRSEGAPPTRWMVSQDGLAAITKCRSAIGVQVELEKHIIRTATPELMFVPATIDMDKQLLSCMLNSHFNAIYQPAAKTFKPIWSISDQLNKMKGQHGDAHQPASTRLGQGPTRSCDYNLIEQAFGALNEVSRDVDYGLNILDIANMSGRRFTPDNVRDVDILRMIHDKQSRQMSYNRDAATNQSPGQGLSVTLAPEWMILSMHGAVSPWHADSAGYCTFVVGIEGQKVWHLVKGDWSETKVEFGIYGTHHNNWNAGVFAVPIGPGCSLIQAPGTPHAVLTPEKTLIAGSFFYTAIHFPRSIECIHLFFAGTLMDNEDIKDYEWVNLTCIVVNLSDQAIFTKQQRYAVVLQLHKLLEFFNLKDPNEKSKRYFRTVVPETLSKRKFSNETVAKFDNAYPKGLGLFLTSCIEVCNNEITSTSS